ncbi:unnamed protein product [Zymoseptoria tritici ST99CH_1A5]|nr:unnamed protein product [Zymoseptoria tritici ST99CH_1E4]SMY28677.1 unnamed protein product [Zymoseptoria tritici ST99CH_1A5]
MRFTTFIVAMAATIGLAAATDYVDCTAPGAYSGAKCCYTPGPGGSCADERTCSYQNPMDPNDKSLGCV